MAINIVKYDLLPVRRDKQVGSGVVSSGGSYSSGGDSGGSGVSLEYVDGSLAIRDIQISAINASLGDTNSILSYVNSSTYYDGSLNARVLKAGDTMTGALTIEGDGDQYLILDNAALGFAEDGAGYGDLVLGRWEPYFLDLTNWASGSDADATVFRVSGHKSLGKEATLALVRGDWPDVEFLDFYNNGYVDSSNYGIRIQKRGTGIFHDFKIDTYDGTNYTPVMNMQLSNLNSSADVITEFTCDVSISGTLTNPTLDTKANKNTSIIYKTSAYTLASTDNNCVIEASGTFGIYLPTNLDTGFKALIMNIGGGTISINASTGATVYTRDSSNDLTKRWTGATVYKRDSTSWAAMGDLQ